MLFGFSPPRATTGSHRASRCHVQLAGNPFQGQRSLLPQAARHPDLPRNARGMPIVLTLSAISVNNPDPFMSRVIDIKRTATHTGIDIAGRSHPLPKFGPKEQSETPPTSFRVDRDSATRRSRRLDVQFDVSGLSFLVSGSPPRSRTSV